jgi:hypothetical protein
MGTVAVGSRDGGRESTPDSLPSTFGSIYFRSKKGKRVTWRKLYIYPKECSRSSARPANATRFTSPLHRSTRAESVLVRRAVRWEWATGTSAPAPLSRLGSGAMPATPGRGCSNSTEGLPTRERQSLFPQNRRIVWICGRDGPGRGYGREIGRSVLLANLAG